MDHKDPRFANQEEVFNNVGLEVLKNAMSGFNACIFAYGQTGSGKSYSMMGAASCPGLIPRITNEMYNHIDQKTSETVKFKIEVSYLEIYNEKVRDLLNPGQPSDKKTLKATGFKYFHIILQIPKRLLVLVSPILATRRHFLLIFTPEMES